MVWPNHTAMGGGRKNESKTPVERRTEDFTKIRYSLPVEILVMLEVGLSHSFMSSIVSRAICRIGELICDLPVSQCNMCVFRSFFLPERELDTISTSLLHDDVRHPTKHRKCLISWETTMTPWTKEN
jgi:hypothetical protein